jgi:ribonuclease R
VSPKGRGGTPKAGGRKKGGKPKRSAAGKSLDAKTARHSNRGPEPARDDDGSAPKRSSGPSASKGPSDLSAPKGSSDRSAPKGPSDRTSSRGRGQMPPRGARPSIAGYLVAVLQRRGRFLTAEPFFDRGRRITVEKSRHHLRADTGDLVLVEPLGPRAGHGKVVHRIGRPDVARDVIEALMYHRGLRRRFDPLVEREARAAAESPADPLAGSRRDLRELPTFTIDPPTAKDFDDAVSAERVGDETLRIWVHIADVTAHLRPDSVVDREARRRATSVYVPGAVEPMLPEALSNTACSLVPHQDRLAVSVEMDFRGHKLVRSAFHRSIIRSDARMDYPQVDRIFAGEEEADAKIKVELAWSREVAAALEAERNRRGALAVESLEPEFAFSHDGHVSEVQAAAQTESHKVIEHLMIAANEAVAAYLEDSRIPGLYRIHEPPDPARIGHLAEQMASLDIPTPAIPETISPQQAVDYAALMSRMAAEHAAKVGRGRIAFSSLVLRSLKQARYAPQNKGHSGLRSPRYTHFTSPIRRYPDVVVHRALLGGLGLGEERPEASSLEELGEWCSERERAAMQIERSADDIARCFVLQAELLERGWETEFEGEVVGLIEAGAFVAFGDGYEGMLPVRRLTGDWWEINELQTMLIGTSSGTTLRLGDSVVVQVEGIEPPRGRVSLSPVTLSTADE